MKYILVGEKGYYAGIEYAQVRFTEHIELAVVLNKEDAEERQAQILRQFKLKLKLEEYGLPSDET